MRILTYFTTVLCLLSFLQALSAESLPTDAAAIFGDGSSTPQWTETVEEKFPYELQILWVETESPIPSKKIVEEKITVALPDGKRQPLQFEFPNITEELEDMAEILTVAVSGNSRGIVKSKGEFSAIYQISQQEKGFNLRLQFRRTLHSGEFKMGDSNPTLIPNSPWTYLGGISGNEETKHRNGTTTSRSFERVLAVRLLTRETSQNTSQKILNAAPSASAPFSVTDTRSPDS